MRSSVCKKVEVLECSTYLRTQKVKRGPHERMSAGLGLYQWRVGRWGLSVPVIGLGTAVGITPASCVVCREPPLSALGILRKCCAIGVLQSALASRADSSRPPSRASTPTKVRVARTGDRRCACVSPATRHHAAVRLDATCSRLRCMITTCDVQAPGNVKRLDASLTERVVSASAPCVADAIQVCGSGSGHGFPAGWG